MSPTWVVLLVYLSAFFPAHIWLLVKNHRTYRTLLDCDKDLIELMADPLPRPDEGLAGISVPSLVGGDCGSCPTRRHSAMSLAPMLLVIFSASAASAEACWLMIVP